MTMGAGAVVVVDSFHSNSPLALREGSHAFVSPLPLPIVSLVEPENNLTNLP